jgi:hypothetical protein
MITLTLTEDQARMAHAALCEACVIARDNQSKMLDLHEAQAITAPVTSKEAWASFLLWQTKEDLAATVADTIRQSGIPLNFVSYGLRRI